MPEDIKPEVEENITEESEVEDDIVFDDDDDPDWDNIKWGKDDDDTKTEDEDEEANTESAEADQPESEDGDKGTEQPAEEETQSEGDQDADQWLELKHMDDEPRRVSKEEAKVLAQKGLDYDRIREERDSLKANSARYTEMEKFLNELKGDYATIEDMMDGIRAQMLTEKDNSLTQEAALEKAKAMRAPAPAPAAAEPAKQNNRAVDDFIKAYPDVKAEDIPKSVWDETKRTGNLVAAYARYETQQLKDANKKLQEALDAEKQNAKNKERSAGSAKSSGTKSTKSLIQTLWDEDDY